MTVKIDYTREELIAICEAATVNEKDWHDRDSYGAQFQLGQCWALLKAGCRFVVHTPENSKPDESCVTSEKTIWLTTFGKGFKYFEVHEARYCGDNCDCFEEELHYLPTQKRLDEREGGDWY